MSATNIVLLSVSLLTNSTPGLFEPTGQSNMFQRQITHQVFRRYELGYREEDSHWFFKTTPKNKVLMTLHEQLTNWITYDKMLITYDKMLITTPQTNTNNATSP